ncbi:uncharacterized protein LOC117603584 isoform X2 [Osmia lignaria lignaria]|uniref:uncharacterized protein LOC117603584 isoform X2 n=1 Tax=Osmia lignaria lignaria TaxID=1437193 RepID=UPI00402B9771
MLNQVPKLGEKKIRDKNETWIFFNVTNYRTLMRYCIFINTCMGFLRFKIVSSRKSRFSFSAILVIIFSICMVIAIYNVNYVIKTEVRAILHCNFILFVSPMIVICGYISNHSTVRMIEKVENVATLLPPKTIRKLAKLVYTKDALLFIPFCLIYRTGVMSLGYIIGCSFNYVLLSMVAANSLYVNNVYVLKACFKKINDSLVKLNEMVINEEPHLFSRVYQSQENPELLKQLRNLRKQHLKITAAVRLINETYNIQNIGSLTMHFIHITFNVYHYVVLFTQEDIVSAWFFENSIYIIYYTFNLTLIVWTTETTKNQAQKIGSNVHRIVVNTFDKQTTIELELFSLQVLQCDSTFSAMGLPMDATILTKIMCSISTYVVLLVQYLLVTPC